MPQQSKHPNLSTILTNKPGLLSFLTLRYTYHLHTLLCIHQQW